MVRETRERYQTRVEAEVSRFKIRAKGEVDVELMRALDAKSERRGILEAEARTREQMAEEALEGDTKRRKE